MLADGGSRTYARIHDPAALGDSCTHPELVALESSLASRFRPKTVGAVAQDAARLAKALSGGETAESGDSGKRSGKRLRPVDISDNDDDKSDDDEDA